MFKYIPPRWSPVELEYLQNNLDKPIMQLTIALSKSQNAIKNKIIEIKTGEPPKQVKKKNIHSNIGRREDLKKFYRSGVEANLHRLLNTLPEVKLIEYEPTDFTFFQFGIKKGTVSYTPDFKVTYQDGTYKWIEVKGNWLKPVDKVKIRRFKKYFPEEAKNLVAVTSTKNSKTTTFFIEEGFNILYYYTELNKKWKNIIPNWE